MKNHQPLVSVVIPLYNAQKHISETIESVLSQSYESWELIVVDDCSTDNSVDVVKRYVGLDSRIKLIESEINFGGPARPRNIGIECAKGEYIAFLDADDVWLEDKLKIQIEYMQTYKLNFSSTAKLNINEVSENINFKANLLSKLKTSKKDICDLIKNRFIFTSSVIIAKSILVHFSEEKKYVAVEDLCAWLMIFNHPEVKYGFLNQRLLKYRIVKQSISDRSMEYKHATKAYMCILDFILKYDLYRYMRCFYFACARDYSLNFLQKKLRR